MNFLEQFLHKLSTDELLKFFEREKHILGEKYIPMDMTKEMCLEERTYLINKFIKNKNKESIKNRYRVTFVNMCVGVYSQPLSMRLVTASRPVLTFDGDDYNSDAWITGKYSWKPVSITIEVDATSSTASEFVTAIIHQQLQTQQHRFVTYLDILDDNEEITERWTLGGCWIQNVDYTNLDYSSGNLLQITLQIRFEQQAYQTAYQVPLGEQINWWKCWSNNG